MSLSFARHIPSFNPPKVSAWAVKLGRLGLAARGFVYVMLGFLAMKTAAGLGGKLTDREGAVGEIERLPFGHGVLWVVALGLIGYVLWRFAQAFMDLDGNGTDAKGLRKRAAALGSGLAHASVSTAAVALAARRPDLSLGGRSQGGGDAAAQDWTAWLMSQSFGRWLVGIAGAVILGVAIYQIYQAISCKFSKHLRGGGLTANQETWARRIGRAGYTARGVAFGLIAWFILQAALKSDASQAGGLAAAFRKLAEQPYGMWLLGAVGLGFSMFGVHSIVEARYRRIGR